MPFKARYFLVVVVCGWAVFHYFHAQSGQLAALARADKRLHTELTAGQAHQEQLKRQVAEFQSKDYIARYASTRFNLIMPGQVAFDVH